MKDILKGVMYAGLFVVPFLTLYVANSNFFPFITGKNFWFRIIVDITVAAWAILALYDAKYRPRFSWILVGFSALIIAMFFANLFGQHPQTSFWSNFERMDGYVSLVHTFLYMLVLGSVLRTKEQWKQLLNTSVVVSFMVALYGLAQYGGIAEGSGRIDSRLGNAAYMAIYMLFHIFIIFWLFIQTKRPNLKIIYALLAVLYTFVLIETGTRGTALGLAVGVIVMSGYIGLFGTKFKEFRKYAIGGFAIILIAISGFVFARDTAVIQNSPNLARIANISLDDLAIRGTIWGMAWEGVKERPVLGWGQGNFNYVFNEQYDPALYAQEQWFDRAHNIFMDWLIAGGFVGLVLYLSIFAACAYYLLVRPIINKNDESFTVLERGILLGLLAGYFTHNFVVFDNIVSYIFFAVILGLIHARVSTPLKGLEETKVEESVITQFAAPVIGVLLVAVIYFAHVPGMQVASGIIDAFSQENSTLRLELFKDVLVYDSFAHQEITEQISQQAMGMMRDQNVTPEVRQAYAELAETELMKLAQEKPSDARIHVFIGSFYRATNQLDKAAEQMAIAQTLSPRKQAIIIQQGFIALSQSNNEAARDFFKTAFELDTRFLEAREYYAASLFYTNQAAEAKALMDSDAAVVRFADSDFLLAAANQAGETDFLIELFESKVTTEPTNPQNWATLAFLYYEKGDADKAVATLDEAKVMIPTFATAATCIAGNIQAGSENPGEGC
jgi:O-antigen ligase/cytochrome c-type biogenesis protein CcmH/NrfG